MTPDDSVAQATWWTAIIAGSSIIAGIIGSVITRVRENGILTHRVDSLEHGFEIHVRTNAEAFTAIADSHRILADKHQLLELKQISDMGNINAKIERLVTRQDLRDAVEDIKESIRTESFRHD